MANQELIFCGQNFCWSRTKRPEGFNQNTGRSVAAEFVESNSGDGEKVVNMLERGEKVEVNTSDGDEVSLYCSSKCLNVCSMAPSAALVRKGFLRRQSTVDNATNLIENLTG